MTKFTKEELRDIYENKPTEATHYGEDILTHYAGYYVVSEAGVVHSIDDEGFLQHSVRSTETMIVLANIVLIYVPEEEDLHYTQEMIDNGEPLQVGMKFQLNESIQRLTTYKALLVNQDTVIIQNCDGAGEAKRLKSILPIPTKQKKLLSSMPYSFYHGGVDQYFKVEDCVDIKIFEYCL